jgi:hypothetical protein
MMVYASMSYWDVYAMPVPLRKWLIHRYNKHVSEQDKGSSNMEEPLSKVERVKMIKNAQQPNPLKSHEFMRPVRNK